MPKEGDKSIIFCSKCKANTPHTYQSSTLGDLSRKLVGRGLGDIGSGWYCDNCGKKNYPQTEYGGDIFQSEQEKRGIIQSESEREEREDRRRERHL